jgi:hypothetical protein
MRLPRLNDSGICLAEAMIAMAAGAVVLSATIQALDHFERRLWIQHDTMAHHQDVRIGLNIMESELRLAGTGAALLGAGHGTALLRAEPQEVQFLANLEGLTTTLTEPAFPGQHGLTVSDGSSWAKGKRIVICGIEHWEENRLARDGRRTGLSLAGPLDHAFPVGSMVFVSNSVRYYLGKDGRGRSALMRQVDGGSNPLIGDVTMFRLRYLDKDGKPTQDTSRVTRVHMELAVGDGHRTFMSEVSLRTT